MFREKPTRNRLSQQYFYNEINDNLKFTSENRKIDAGFGQLILTKNLQLFVDSAHIAQSRHKVSVIDEAEKLVRPVCTSSCMTKFYIYVLPHWHEPDHLLGLRFI